MDIPRNPNDKSHKDTIKPAQVQEPRATHLNLADASRFPPTNENPLQVDANLAESYNVDMSAPDALEQLKKIYAEKYEEMFGSQADAATKVKNTIAKDIVDVTQNLVHIALHSPNERIRVDVAKFLLDRTVFKASATEDEIQQWMAQLSGKA